MPHPLLMPKLGLTMTEGLLSEWLVTIGAQFKMGDTLFVVETDKVATEVEAQADGVLADIVVGPGQTVPVGAVVGSWTESAQEGPSGAIRILATPLARRMAAHQGIVLESVDGSGPGGRIKAADVEEAAKQHVPMSHSEATATAPEPVTAASQSGAMSDTVDLGMRSKPDSIHATMARRLTEVKQTVPHFYMSIDVQAAPLLALRAQRNQLTSATHLTLTHFLVAAVGRALRDTPRANRVWDHGDVVTYDSTDVGLAVNTERGLFVPVVRGAGNASLDEVSRRTANKVMDARDGKLSPDDSAGGAISISNAGMYKVKYLTPIINPGQAMILGVGSINQIFRPDDQGRPVLCQEMGLVLAADHRILDGVSGLHFLNCVVGYLEQPLKLLDGNP
ncbi:MAG: 2-oxo acid dehydrogenase subunit E2 [Candidimonas sp.]|nr:MAG: 2-oxo acid dehydrogenase subunit E2 [Candidimonas sp.]TAM22200.1 MAG: 2-oxo acid dehydrogenase subunit E2 [Candidimonas sp.]